MAHDSKKLNASISWFSLLVVIFQPKMYFEKFLQIEAHFSVEHKLYQNGNSAAPRYDHDWMRNPKRPIGLV